MRPVILGAGATGQSAGRVARPPPAARCRGQLHPDRAAELRRRYGTDATVVQADLRTLWFPRRPFRVVANPPYTLSTRVLRDLLGHDRLLSAGLGIQRAVARRLAAAPPGQARHTRRYR